jgi:hypothetical protein
MVPFGVIGCNTVGFTPYELLFFWFAVGANVIWIVVPLWLIWGAADKIAQDALQASCQLNPASPRKAQLGDRGSGMGSPSPGAIKKRA